MAQIEIDQLPGYPTKIDSPLVLDEFNYTSHSVTRYPIPDFNIVCDNTISIVDKTFHQLDPKISLKLLHYLYGPDEISFRITRGMNIPRLFLKEFFRNNWIECGKYNKPITLFTSDYTGINVDLQNQLVLRQSNVVDAQHPYYQKIAEINKVMEISRWPWITLEIFINNVRPGELILNQIQLYEIDLGLKYYLEVDDITPFTAYQLTN